MRLREPLDAAGNRGLRVMGTAAQVRDLRRTRPSARGFPSSACIAALARFASATCFRPFSRSAISARH